MPALLPRRGGLSPNIRSSGTGNAIRAALASVLEIGSKGPESFALSAALWPPYLFTLIS